MQKYKQTDAYKRLLRRQAQAVRRLERIKANFEKKRKQVNMLTIQRDGMGSSIEEDDGVSNEMYNSFSRTKKNLPFQGLYEAHKLNVFHNT